MTRQLTLQVLNSGVHEWKDICDSNLLVRSLNVLSSFLCNYLDCCLTLLAPALRVRGGWFHLYLHRGIYWTIKPATAPPRLQLAQQVRHQGRKQPRMWGSEPGAAAFSMGLQVLSPLSAERSLTCPGHAVMVQGLESCKQKCCWGSPFRPAASSERQVHLQMADQIFPLNIYLEIMGEAQGKQAWWHSAKLLHFHDKLISLEAASRSIPSLLQHSESSPTLSTV